MLMPIELKSALENLGEGQSLAKLSTAYASLGEQYRERSNAPQLDDEQRLAYVLARMPATYAAIRSVLARLPEDMEVTSLLDLGAGPGTGAWAMIDRSPELERVVLVERDQGFIRLAQKLMAPSGIDQDFEMTWLQEDLRVCLASTPAASDAIETFDAVLMSYSLGEITQASREALIKQAWKRCAGVLIIIEPGTPDGFAAISQVRKLMLEISEGHLVGPCTHDLGCPLLGEEQWCHYSERLSRSKMHKFLKEGSLGYEDEKFSWVAFSRQAYPRAVGRVIGHPDVNKAQVTLNVCTAAGYQRAIIPKRSGHPYRIAKKLEWGDEMPADVIPDGQGS